MNMEYIQVAISTVASLIALFLLTKLMGNKQVSQMNMFDYIVGISIGSIAAEMATELESPLNSLLAMVIYGVTAFAASIISMKSLGLRKILAGRPLVLFDNGKIYRENLKKARLDISELLLQGRIAGYFNLSDIRTVIIESNGALSFLPFSDKRPIVPNDMNITPTQESIQTSVILDGKINKENLKLTGNNEVWLRKQLKEQEHESIGDIALALCADDNTLTVFPAYKKKNYTDFAE